MERKNRELASAKQDIKRIDTQSKERELNYIKRIAYGTNLTESENRQLLQVKNMKDDERQATNPASADSLRFMTEPVVDENDDENHQKGRSTFNYVKKSPQNTPLRSPRR